MPMSGRISGARFFQSRKSGAGFLVRDFCPGFARAESGAGFWEIPHQLVQDFTLRFILLGTTYRRKSVQTARMIEFCQA